MKLSDLEALVKQLRIKAKDADPNVLFRCYEHREEAHYDIRMPSKLSDARIFDGIDDGVIVGGDYVFAIEHRLPEH